MQSPSPKTSYSFQSSFVRKEFGLANLLAYLWCDLAMLVGLKQEPWTRYNHLVPLKIWNCREPVLYGKLQHLSMEAGAIKDNVKLHPCVLNWLKEDETRFKTARFGDLTHAIHTSQVRRRVRTASPGQGGLTLDESVSGFNLNAADGLTSYSNDERWQAHGPQTLQDACSFVRRVVKSMSKIVLR